MLKKTTIHNQNLPAKQFCIVTVYCAIMLVLLLLNFAAYLSPGDVQISITGASESAAIVVALRNFIFLITGILLLGISSFAFLQLSAYATGREFGFYTLFSALSIGTAPCLMLNSTLMNFLHSILRLGASTFLFRTVSYLTLQKDKLLYHILQAILISGSIVIALADLQWTYAYISRTDIVCVCLTVGCSILLMVANYRKSNEYTKRQFKMLIRGLGLGGILLCATEYLPEIAVFQNNAEFTETTVEVTAIGDAGVNLSVPLLLFAGFTITILLVLLRREFSVRDMRLRLRYFLFAPLYLAVIAFLLFVYGNLPLWTITLILFLIILPFLVCFWNFFLSVQSTELQNYEWQLMSEVEKEKESLAAFLHDDVLQSLIAFYRRIRADKSDNEMETALSELIANVRRASHNLYPTIVEDLGLEQSLQICISELQNDYPNVEFTFQYEFSGGILPKTISLTVYRTARELLTNAAKHSRGTAASLRLCEDNVGYYLYVRDNGKGMRGSDDASHRGLFTVKKQIAALGGRIDLRTGEDGTNCAVFIPKER